ncbi:MAG: hypothetical protein DRO98_02075 [Archaeoglobales archaeon]|nr:MAG: hypothetical protein DRO98_02075 [Archaeoglobales archaeon]
MVSKVFAVMGEILNLLREKECEIGEISEVLGIPEPKVREILQTLIGTELIEVNGKVKLSSFGKAITEMSVE